MSRFTHSICDECWKKKKGDAIPFRVVPPTPILRCCYCEKEHNSGIYVREDPADLSCNGVHNDD